mmetsp:Transcript_50962/g.147936  ORF Transcript_50962/g.147936 Transcript_50962/m.147936 type:complete len:231 (+) Transcript_50962:255-947(+)
MLDIKRATAGAEGERCRRHSHHACAGQGHQNSDAIIVNGTGCEEGPWARLLLGGLLPGGLLLCGLPCVLNKVLCMAKAPHAGLLCSPSCVGEIIHHLLSLALDLEELPLGTFFGLLSSLLRMTLQAFASLLSLAPNPLIHVLANAGLLLSPRSCHAKPFNILSSLFGLLPETLCFLLVGLLNGLKHRVHVSGFQMIQMLQLVHDVSDSVLRLCDFRGVGHSQRGSIQGLH